MDLSEFTALKEKAERLQREKDRAEGALQEIFSRLKRDYACNNVKEAQAQLEKFEKEAARLQAEIAAALKEVDEKFGALLE